MDFGGVGIRILVELERLRLRGSISSATNYRGRSQLGMLDGTLVLAIRCRYLPLAFRMRTSLTPRGQCASRVRWQREPPMFDANGFGSWTVRRRLRCSTPVFAKSSLRISPV